MCTYLGAVALGNAFTAGVNFYVERSKTTSLHAGYFFFFVLVMVVAAALFGFFARFYKGKAYIQDQASPQPA
jgi:POT family proton-dependent oligopeptide transporter